MINYCDNVSVLTRTTVSDDQGGLTEAWSNLNKATFDNDLSVGTLAIGDTITGGVNGYTAIITAIDYDLETIEYAELSNDDDFEIAEELADGEMVPSSIVLVTILGTVDSVFKGRISKIAGNEAVLSSKLAEKSTHILYSPFRPITVLNRIDSDGNIYNVASVFIGRDLFGTVKHLEIQLELVE